MDIGSLEKELTLLRGELNSCALGYGLYYYPVLYAKAANSIEHCEKILLNHQTFLEEVWVKNISVHDAKDMLDYLIQLIKNEKKTMTRPKGESHNIFKTAADKVEAASLALEKEDWNGVMNSLNTALEISLKDKLDIPTTISHINTNRIIEILVSHKLGPTEHLKEVKRYVYLTNASKHMGYENQKVDCIRAIKSVLDLLSRLEKAEIKLTQEVKDKIYGAV